MKRLSVNYRFDGEKQVLNGASVWFSASEIEFIKKAVEKCPKLANVIAESARLGVVECLNSL